jgi:probable rRNA maturation factor
MTPSSGGDRRGAANRPFSPAKRRRGQEASPWRSAVEGAGPAVDVLIESPQWQQLPGAEGIIRAAIAGATKAGPVEKSRGEVCVLLCDDAAMAALNARWRGHEGPTNVLSFPAPRGALDRHGADRPIPLGDIAIAYETLAREAADCGKPLRDHLAHLAIHGFLHLLGYDHELDGEARRMERLERDILAEMGIPNPYERRTEDRTDGGR